MRYGPLRILRPAATQNGPVFHFYSGTTDGPTKSDLYLDRLVKLIPSEIIAIYLAGVAYFDSVDQENREIFALVCLFVLIFVRIWATSEKEIIDSIGQFFNIFKSAQYIAILLSCVSFVIWVNIVGDTFYYISDLIPNRWWGPVMLVWTVVVPGFYNGNAPA